MALGETWMHNIPRFLRNSLLADSEACAYVLRDGLALHLVAETVKIVNGVVLKRKS